MGFLYYGPPPSPFQPNTMLIIGKKEAMPINTNNRTLYTLNNFNLITFLLNEMN